MTTREHIEPEEPLKQTYTMVCDICGETFQSPDAWLDPPICPECMPKPLPENIQKIREAVADFFARLHYTTLERSRGKVGEMVYYHQADELLSELNELGVVVLADNQEPPRVVNRFLLATIPYAKYYEGQRDYVKAGGRLVVSIVTGTPREG
jgi:hypothetical protein